jgi:hypothetical protein
VSRRLRIVWVSFAPLEKTSAGLASNVASVRYRITVPAAALSAEDFECRVMHLGLNANRHSLLARFEGAEAVILGKLLGGRGFEAIGRLVLELVPELQTRGVKVLADFSDDHFSHPQLGPAFRGLANLVDRVTASTPQLGEVIREQTSAPITVIADPVEGPRGQPRVGRSSEACALLWFGHPSNLDTLRYGLPQIERTSVGYSLTLVTAPGAGAERLAGELSERGHGTGRTCRFRPWSTKAVFEELQACDTVVIPSNPYDPRKRVKSPNRFTESVWAGRFVLAHPLPAYDALAEYGWVGEDLGEGLQWYRANAAAAREKIERGQATIAERHTPAAIALSWKKAIHSTLGLE